MTDWLTPEDVDIPHLLAEHRAATDEIKRLRAALAEAIEDIESWGAYAGDYFQEKWDLAGDIARYRAILHGESNR